VSEKEEIMKYQKKPVVIEAFKYDGDLKGADGKYYVPNWAVEAYEKGIMHYGALKLDEPPCELYIDTLEGTHHVSVGDYVIQGIQGELYPCKPDIFEESYEAYYALSPLLDYQTGPCLYIRQHGHPGWEGSKCRGFSTTIGEEPAEKCKDCERWCYFDED
jgi:hypothetical protein